MKGAVTGSVAMNTVPKAQLPSTMCHQKGMAKKGLVFEPMALKSRAIATVPIVTPAMIRHEPTPVTMRITAPMRHASAEVSPSRARLEAR